jgi:RHS repeat-associated protein
MLRINKILVLFLLMLSGVKEVCAAEETYFNELRGSAVAPSNTLFVTDEKFRSYTTSEWTKLTTASVKNYVSFELNVDTSLYFYSRPFTSTLNATIHFYGDKSDTSLETSAPQTIDLVINFDTVRGKTYKGIALYKFQGAYKFKVVINSITSPQLGSTPPAIFRVTGKTVIQRQYEFADNSTDVTVFQLPNPDQLRVSWTPDLFPGAEQFDLEWTVVDSLSVIAQSIRNSLIGGQISNNIPLDTLNAWFRNNASRITTAASSYTFNLAYNSGYLLYRIRGVQVHFGDNIRYEGNWNYSASLPGGSLQHAIVVIGWHQQNLNWQYNGSFAEEGKRKEVIQYFDGSLRNRQAVTLDNSNQVAVVQETIYDAEGRVSASILPAPVNENILKYFPAFNRNNSNQPYSFADLNYADCHLTAGLLSTASGAAQYYSANNTFTGSLHRNYIPSANGYPLAVTEYMPDNTGRISVQGGVGAEYQLGTGHQTSYYYGKPTQVELDRLFGSEAGNASHYLKNMVADPNGQLSVSYVNASGKTIATALAGRVPDSLTALPSTAGASTIIEDDLIKTEDFALNMSNYSLQASAAFTAPVTGSFHFKYSLDPKQLKIIHGASQVICSNCYYDLKIEVKDNCNNLLQSATRPAGNVFDPGCTTLQTLSDSFDVAISTIGQYYVGYELVISRNALNYYDSLNLANNTNILKQSVFVSEELRKIDLTSCFNNCASCLEEIGSLADFMGRFRNLYLSDSLDFVAADSIYIIGLYNDAIVKCNALRASGCAQSPCQEKLDLIKPDVSPGGQYALFHIDGSNNFYADGPGQLNVLTRYHEVFSFPNESGVPDTVVIKNIYGEDSLRLPVNQLSLSQFISNWKSSWADSLARFHPEYCYYLWCVNQSNYVGFDQKIKNAVTDGTTAITGGYFSTSNTIALLDQDPFFSPSENSGDSTLYKQMRSKLNYYSREMAGYSLADRSLLDIVKIMLYCKNGGSPWDGCQIDDSCRSVDKEWDLYKELYFNLKEAFYERKRLATPAFAACKNCYIGKDVLQQAFLSNGGTDSLPPALSGGTPAYYNPLTCPTPCPDNMIYFPSDRPGISYYVKVGARNYPPTPPTGYTNGSYYAAFTIATGSSNECVFFNVWVFIKDPVSIITPPNPPSTCDDDSRVPLYTTKQRRFTGYVNASEMNAAILSGNPQTQIAQQQLAMQSVYASSCAANADAWISTLSGCVNSGNPVTDSTLMAQLKQAFIQICTSGSVAAGVNGASSAPDTASLTYKTFEQAIIGILGSSAINTQCAVELLSGAYPYNRQPVMVLQKIDETDYDICSRLSAWRTQFQASGSSLSFYSYLLQEIGKGFTISESQLQDIERSCTNCNNIVRRQTPLPVALMGVRRTNISCTTLDSLQTAFSNKFTGLASGSVVYETLRTNFFNQSLGFSLTYDDYQSFIDKCSVTTTARLYDEAATPESITDNYACMSDLFTSAAAAARFRYKDYIDSVRADFREAYLNRCMSARAGAKMKAELFEYHYTLYYYDQSGNLVKTVPPAGVTLLTQAQVDSVQTDRQYGRSNCYTYTDDLSFNGTAAKAFANNPLFNPGTGSFTIESYIRLANYSDQSIVSYYDTAGRKGYRLAIQNGKLVFRLQGSNMEYYQVSTTDNVADMFPLNEWVHVTTAHQSSLRSNRRSYFVINGNERTVVVHQQNFGRFTNINPVNISTKLLIGADSRDSIAKFSGRIKQLRLYRRALTVQEARQNYTSVCLTPASQNGLVLWAPVNEGEGEIRNIVGADTSISINGSLAWIRNRTGIYPHHTLATIYDYNSLNQVIKQNTPDAGESRFWYDRLGRLTASQNSEQLSPSNGGGSNRYSYTRYDVQGRIVEVGEKTGASAITGINTLDSTALASWLNSGHDYQVTKTLYDEVNTTVVSFTNITDNQTNLRKRVTTTLYKEDGTAGSYDNATHYSYDINGNVKTLWQEIGKLRPYSDNGIKQIDYDYDLASGKVNRVTYQPNKGDQFIYRYGYDAGNRITSAYSSRDGLIWATDAEYRYYLHGPLARTELGTFKVQGIDYAYTIQGWLKGMNTTNLAGATNITGDMGGDGINGSRISKDIAGFALHYNNQDYTGIGSNAQSFAALPGGGGAGAGGLFNGNISAMSVNLQGTSQPLLYRYSYDQLNRLINKNVFNGLDTNNHWTPISLDDYKETLTYDPNGNILTNKRNGTTANSNPLAMDDLTYHYQANTNKLTYVSDAVSAGNYTNDIDNQSSGNYTYDKIGNLIADNAEDLQNVQWTVYGKIRSITKSGTGIDYAYNASGSRIYKKVETGGTANQQVYVRDAQGNCLAVYQIKNDTTKWAEQHLYGSGRLGIYNYSQPIPAASLVTTSSTPTLADSLMTGANTYEITNHLGNVMGVISDKKIGVVSATDTTIVGYYAAEIVNTHDYYAFGMEMMGRTYNAISSYRYGFNGKEQDNDIDGNSYDYGYRIYNPRLGRFLSTDPLYKDYAHLTPYQFASNSPIFSIDRDGREFEPYWATTVPQKISAYENELRKKDPAHAEQIIFQKNINAFLFVGGALTAGFAIETYGFIPLLTNSLKMGVVGSVANSTIAWANGGDKYEIAKSATSGFFSGAILGVGGASASISKLLSIGAISGGLGEIVNEEFDSKFGKGSGYDLQKIMTSAGIGAVANLLSNGIVDKISEEIDKQLVKSLAQTETGTYQNTIKKAILERSPRIGTKQLKQAISAEIKSAQQLLKKQAEGTKVAVKQAIERSVDYLQDKTNNATNKSDK